MLGRGVGCAAMHEVQGCTVVVQTASSDDVLGLSNVTLLNGLNTYSTIQCVTPQPWLINSHMSQDVKWESDNASLP